MTISSYIFFIGILIIHVVDEVSNLSTVPSALLGPLDKFLRFTEERSSEHFSDFLDRLLRYLSVVEGSKGKRVVEAMSTALAPLEEYRFVGKRLVPGLKEISKDADVIHENGKVYQAYLKGDHPALKSFLEDFDHLFTLQQGVLFSDHIHTLKGFLTGHLPPIAMEQSTKRVVNVIANEVYQLSEKHKKELQEKLIEAVKEYDRVSLSLSNK